MKILEYDQVDPVSVLHLNMLALNFPLTPEHVARIRRTDPRPFPGLGVYAIEDDQVIGQVGVFRLPMVSTEGREDVGGVWAVSTHPQYSGRGVASRLLQEAHIRMQEAGLRFSTLGTNRYRVAYPLYQRHGYDDLQVWATALARWETAHQPTRLQAKPPGPEGFDLVERVFENVAGEYLGFAWRHKPFARLRAKVNLEDTWMIWENDRPVGYALAQVDPRMVNISDLFLEIGVDAVEAVAAVVGRTRSSYVQVTVSRPSDISRLQRSGYQIAYPNWSAFMLKPLSPEITVEDARQLFGIGTDQFLISWLDTT